LTKNLHLTTGGLWFNCFSLFLSASIFVSDVVKEQCCL